MNLVCKDVGLSQKLVDTYGTKTDLSENSEDILAGKNEVWI